ncbi:glycosyltransferase family 4 protein [Acidianus brierleyi]|uniref:Glycosyltransferase family 1 protein n=1 Tax=Acidianus brierleyi TaxID=41673 RepID=A0A2U9ID47_9CREN|nr:glycosyltransferase family 1 protein [Acidianus brierleyi]AWR93958.1 glycosyltransferase [Acidianus brierleyi]
MKIALMGFAGTSREWSLGRLTYLFYNGLTSLNQDVYIISKKNLDPQFKYVKLKEYRKIFGKDIITDLFSNYFTVRRLNPDIYHFIYPHVSASLMLTLPSRYKKIMTVHDLKPLILRQFMNRSEKLNISILKYTLKRIDGTIAISESTRDQIISMLDIDENKVFVVYNPVDPIFRRLNNEEISGIKEKYGNFILNVSRYDELKNPKNLIKSFRLISKCTDNIKLVIVGAYWKHGIDMIKKELGEYSKNVIILEWLNNEELVKLYNASQAFLFPSLYEGFGMPIIEAMASGAPVITSDRWSMKELAEGNGILVNPEDPEDIAEKTCKVISTPSLQSELRIKGLEKAKEFNYITISEKLLKVYREV